MPRQEGWPSSGVSAQGPEITTGRETETAEGAQHGWEGESRVDNENQVRSALVI